MTRKQNARQDRPDARDFAYSAPRAIRDALPSSVDLRPADWPVWDQGGLNSCTAQAAAGAMEFLYLEEKHDLEPSRLFIYFNSREIYAAEIHQPVGDDDPVYMRDAIKAVAKQGVCTEASWPYVENCVGDKPPATCYVQASDHHAIQYHKVPRDAAHLRGCLAHGFPFTIMIELWQGDLPAMPPNGTIPMPDTQNDVRSGGHALLIVGYDDRAQLFTVRNSYGADWGQQGYGTIPYEFVLDEELAGSFWVVRHAD